MGEILAGSSFERDDPRVAGLMLELIRSDDPKEQQRGLAALVEESQWEEPGPRPDEFEFPVGWTIYRIKGGG